MYIDAGAAEYRESQKEKYRWGLDSCSPKSNLYKAANCRTFSRHFFLRISEPR